jgi:hypothetical protein
MSFLIYIQDSQKSDLEYVKISLQIKLYFYRKVEKKIHDNAQDTLPSLLRVINYSNAIAMKPALNLELDDDLASIVPYSFYESRLPDCFSSLGTLEFIEFLCCLVSNEFLSIQEVNDRLEQDDQFFQLQKTNSGVFVEILSQPIAVSGDKHPNIIASIKRMEILFGSHDYAGVLDASAVVIESHSKIQLSSPKLKDQTFGSYFQSYQNHSKLPQEITNYMLEIYKRRNVEPLASHGSSDPPTITRFDAHFILLFTKAIVQLENDGLS